WRYCRTSTSRPSSSTGMAATDPRCLTTSRRAFVPPSSCISSSSRERIFPSYTRRWLRTRTAGLPLAEDIASALADGKFVHASGRPAPGRAGGGLSAAVAGGPACPFGHEVGGGAGVAHAGLDPLDGLCEVLLARVQVVGLAVRLRRLLEAPAMVGGVHGQLVGEGLLRDPDVMQPGGLGVALVRAAAPVRESRLELAALGELVAGLELAVHREHGLDGIG